MPRRKPTTVDLDAPPENPRPHPGPVSFVLIDPLHSPLEQVFEVLQGTVSLSCIGPGEYETLRTRLGIPTARHIVSVEMWNPWRWWGYCFVVRGTYAPITHDAETAPRFTLRVYDHEELDPEKAWEDLPLVAWQRVVCIPGTPVCLEALWHPERGEEQWAAHGIERAEDPQAAVSRALRGLGLLHEAAHGGRPRGSGTFRSAEDFESQIIKIARQLISKQVYPSQERVAKRFERDARTLRDWCTRHHTSWQTLIKRAHDIPS